jgi:hypothetical protein
MADTNTNTSTRDVVINTIDIVNSAGQKESVKEGMFNVLNIYENIYSPTITGSIQIIDGINLYSKLKLHGNEYITISFNRPNENLEDQKYKKTFRIYKVTDRKPLPKRQAQTYVLHFCSEELIFSNQITLSKKYADATSTNYVYSICKDILKINSKKLPLSNFESSLGTSEYILTKYKPFEAIEYITKNSFNFNESTFLFFENRDGFNFKSIEKLFENKVVNTLDYNTAKMTNEQDTAAFSNSNDVNNFKFEKTFDILDNTSKPTYSGKLLTLDLITQKYADYNYSHVNGLSRNSLIDGVFPINDAKNRNEKTMYEEYDGQINYWLTNYNQTNKQYFISKNVRVVNTNIERTLLQRETQLNMLKNTELHCIVPGNQFYTVGYLVEFNVPAFIPGQKSERANDPYYSGKYLITGVRHVITPSGGMQTALRLSKNSTAISLGQAKDSDGNYRKARGY